MTSILKVSEIQDPTNSNTALTIDSSGRVLMPQKPAFHLRWSANQSATATGYQRLNFDEEVFDIGSNVSGAVFTAPVSGVYQFNLSQRFDNIGTGFVIIGLSDDATTHTFSTLWYSTYRILGTPPTNYFTLQSSITWQLTAGDVVAPWYLSQDASYILTSAGGHFSGFLVG